MTAVLYFVDIYFVLVRSYGPSKAGIQLLYYTPGIGLGVYRNPSISSAQNKHGANSRQSQCTSVTSVRGKHSFPFS